MLFVEIDKGKPLQPQAGAVVPVDRRTDPSPSGRKVVLSGMFGRAAAFAMRFVTSGPAQVDAPNDWNSLPQYGMELRNAKESLHEMLNQSGTVTIDPDLANAFHIELTGPSMLVIGNPAPLPAGQPARACSSMINVIIYRNGNPMTFHESIWFANGDAEFDGDTGPDDFSFKINVSPTFGTRIYGYSTGPNFGPAS